MLLKIFVIQKDFMKKKGRREGREGGIGLALYLILPYETLYRVEEQLGIWFSRHHNAP